MESGDQQIEGALWQQEPRRGRAPDWARLRQNAQPQEANNEHADDEHNNSASDNEDARRKYIFEILQRVQPR